MTTVPLLDAARGHPARHTPVWFMRQAGRSLPEYRAVRGEGSILDAIKRPELAAEITVQPVRRYGVDAAVLYSDIVVPAHAVGFGIDVAPGTGPVAETPLRSRDDLERLRPLEPDDIGYVADTVKLVAAELPAEVPVLAFAGAPFTVASYLIEGRPSRTYEHTKALLHTDEQLWHDVMGRLAAMAVTFIDVQLANGAGAFQLFDSWAGALGRADYERYVLPHSRQVFAELAARHPAVPGIHFGIGCDHVLEAMWDAGPAVIGLDWRTPIRSARRRLGPDVAVQGNLDPALVLAGADVALAGARAVLADNGGHPAHIFNLGHGVHPTSDPGVLKAIVDLVHDAATLGVVVMAYGTPRAPEQIEPYYTDIRRGRPPTAEQLADLTARYEAIGGLSPLLRITEAQRDALQAALDERVPDGTVVGLGFKHVAPSVEDGVTALVGGGADRLVGLVLAPHHSRFSVGEYQARAGAAARAAGVPFVGIASWATEPAYVDFLAAEVRRGLATLPAGSRVVFTADSLPERILATGDRYPDELRSTADAVAGAVGLDESAWSIAWQSAGRTPEPWLGPDILGVVDDLAAAGAPGVLVCPCGFVADHLEVLYDLDIEARRRAEAAGLAFARTRSLNAEPAVFGALADRVLAHAG